MWAIQGDASRLAAGNVDFVALAHSLAVPSRKRWESSGNLDYYGVGNLRRTYTDHDRDTLRAMTDWHRPFE